MSSHYCAAQQKNQTRITNTHKKTARHTGDGLKTQGVDGERRERREATTGFNVAPLPAAANDIVRIRKHPTSIGPYQDSPHRRSEAFLISNAEIRRSQTGAG